VAFLVPAAALLLIAAAATLVPALQAARVSPLSVLRSD
jgi:ABC-type lipoprotein release transport system permease subunit